MAVKQNVKQKISRLAIVFLSFLVLPGFVLQGCIGVKPITPPPTTVVDGGVYKSTDEGKTWEQKIKIDETNNLSNVNIISLAINPKDSNIMYAGSESSGLYKSENGSDSWQKITLENSVLTPTAAVKFIAIDPKNTDNIYLVVYSGGKDRVLKSGDKGNTWLEVYTLNDPNVRITNLFMDSYDNSIVYISTSQGGFFKGINYGTDWRLVKWLSPSFTVSVITFALNPKDTRIIYLAGSDGIIYKTTDKGNTWQQIYKDSAANTGFGIIASLKIDPNNPSILYAGTNSGLMKTTDSGKTWSNVPTLTTTNIAPLDVIAIDPINSQILYYVIGSMIYKTIDGGTHWEIYNLPTSRIIKIILADPNTQGTIYLGTYLVVPPPTKKKPLQFIPMPGQ